VWTHYGVGGSQRRKPAGSRFPGLLIRQTIKTYLAAIPQPLLTLLDADPPRREALVVIPAPNEVSGYLKSLVKVASGLRRTGSQIFHGSQRSLGFPAHLEAMRFQPVPSTDRGAIGVSGF